MTLDTFFYQIPRDFYFINLKAKIKYIFKKKRREYLMEIFVRTFFSKSRYGNILSYNIICKQT